jgi:acyl-CoA thioesterase-2
MPSSADFESLQDILTLEPIEVNMFRGVSPDDGYPRIFGGLVIAQALLAAYETVPADRTCHSLHCYFIRPGDVRAPVLYQVDRARDGGSFTTRRVTAIQHGQQIFNFAASFQVAEEGYDHQFPAPASPDPDSLPTERELLRGQGGDVPPQVARVTERPWRIEVRWVDPPTIVDPGPKPPRKQVWMRAKEPVASNVRLQQATLAYASDLSFMETALRVHGLNFWTPGLQPASLDHALWFHRPVDFNDWVLFAQDSPSTSQGRGLVRGEMFTRDGTLVASMAQEALMRVRAPR